MTGQWQELKHQDHHEMGIQRGEKSRLSKGAQSTSVTENSTGTGVTLGSRAAPQPCQAERQTQRRGEG